MSVSPPRSFLLRLLVLLLALGTSPLALAADAAGAADKPAKAGLKLPLQAEVERLQQADSGDTQAALALKLNRQALGFLRQAEQDTSSTAAFRQAIDTASKQQKKLQQQMEALPDPDQALTDAYKRWQKADADALSAELIQHQASIAEVQSRVAELQSELEKIQARPDQRGDELASTKARQAELQDQLRELTTDDGGDAVARAQRAALQAEAKALKAHLEMLRLEGVSQPDRKKLLNLEFKKDRAELSLQQRFVEELQQQLSEKRRDVAEQAQQRTSEVASSYADEHPLLRTAAAENAAFGEQLSDLSKQIDAINKLSEREHRRQIIIETTLRRVTQQLRLTERDQSIGRYLFAQHERLARFIDQHKYASRTKRQHAVLANAHLAQIEIDDIVNSLQDVDQAVAETVNANRKQRAWNALDPTERQRITAELRDLYQERAELAATLSQHYSDHIKALNDLVLLEQQVLGKGSDLLGLIERNLWFMPSNAPISLPWFSSMADSIGWLVAPDSWLTALQQLSSAWLGKGWLAGLMLLLVALLLLGRGRMKQRLATIAAQVGQVRHDSFGLSLQAVAITVALSAARPVLALSAGIALTSLDYDSGDDFSLILGKALTLLSFYWFALLFLGNTLRPNGLAQVHFGWRHRALDVVRRNLRWYVPAELTLFLITMMARLHWVASGSGFDDDHLGRTAFVLANLVLALFFWRVLDPRRYAASKDHAEHALWWPAWGLLVVVLLTQAALIGGALAGYYYTTLYLFRIFYDSFLVVVAIYLLYALALRGFVLASRRLDYQRKLSQASKDAKQQANKEAADEAGEALAEVETDKQIDLHEVSSRVQGFLRVLLVIGVVLALGYVWQALTPLLQTLDSTNLWQHQSGEGSGATLVAVSLADLLIAIGIIVLTFTAARNLPGLVEVVYLERIGMKSGNRYAVTQIMRYTIYIVGFTWTINLAGVRWGDVQWLVAAMGVGLGFGLKEIFANFISGLILLFERPVRVGDTITVGDTTGLVARIRIRASTITDFDNKELVIPNQKLITEPLVNWTLSNPITRLTFGIGVAYGSDPEQVQALILDCVKANDKVLVEPKPSVFFTGFGDNALSFQVRVFVSDRVHRMPVTSELHTALNKALTENGIEIPFPQRDLHLRSVDADIAGLNPTAPGKGADPD